mgnify:FL=1|jgi:hypothetical protein
MPNKYILVIVKNKLMTIDTVLPILLELKEKYNISSKVVVSDEMAHNGIRKNVVIRDAIDYVGTELYIGGKSSIKIVEKLFKMAWFCFLFFRLIIGTKVLHFGTFNMFPYSLLGRMFGKNLYFLQNDSFLHSYRKFDTFFGKNSIIIPPIGKNIVAFNDAMTHLDLATDNHKVFMFGNTRTRKSWISYIKHRSDDYFYNYHREVDFSKGCIVLVLGHFNKTKMLRTSHSLRNLFEKTVETLNEVKGDLPVLIKPHVFTDLVVVDEVMSNLDGFYITYLHPTVLATKAKVFICNSYSTTMADAKSIGVGTVEYSDYCIDLLKLSKGKSIGYEYIDEFINNNQDDFKNAIKLMLTANVYSGIFSSNSSDANKLLVELAE